jgi:predicted membrane protein (TIGR00267 family)
MENLRNLWLRAQAYDNLVGISEIARRYFAMNAFDGALTIIGVLMGSLAAKVTDAGVVLTTGMATALTMGISGLWGAYLTESAERKRNINELSSYTLTDLKNTRIGRASRLAIIVVALVDGISPALTAIIILIPFMIVGLLPDIIWAYYSSLALALVTLFGLGLFLGRISQESILIYGLKTVLAGIVAILLSSLLRVPMH